MPTALDTKLVAAALSLIEKFGQTPTSYTSVRTTAFNPSSDSQSKIETERTGFKVAPPNVVSEGMIEKRGFGQNSGVPLLQTGDAITYIAASSISGWTPTTGDLIVFLGLSDLYGVVRVRPLVSGEQVAAWELVCRAVTGGGGS